MPCLQADFKDAECAIALAFGRIFGYLGARSMKRVIRIAAASLGGLLFLCAAIWLLTKVLNDRPETFAGHTVDHWANELASTNSADRRQLAAKVANERIVPELTNVLFTATNDSKLRVALIEQLNELPGVHIFHMYPESRRASAALDLGSLGPTAKAAIPSLFQALQGHDDVVRGPSAKALVQVQADPDVLIPSLIAYLNEPEGGGRDDAAEALAEFGPRAKAAVPVLVKLLPDRSDKDLMRAVRHALKTIDPQAAAAAGLQ